MVGFFKKKTHQTFNSCENNYYYITENYNFTSYLLKQVSKHV